MIPVYNGEKTVARSIDSVLSQTVECHPVVCNDGSTDGTLDMLEGYGSSITIVDGMKNRGLPGANNLLRDHILDSTDAELISWLAADDWWRRDKVENQVRIMEEGNADITYTDTVFVTPDNKASPSEAPDFDFEVLCNINFINGSSVMLRRDVLKELDWDERFRNCEDWDYWIRAYKNGFRFKRVPGFFTANYRHESNLSCDRRKEAYYHTKVCIKHGLPIEIPAARMIRIGQPEMIKGILEAWTE